MLGQFTAFMSIAFILHFWRLGFFGVFCFILDINILVTKDTFRI